MYVLSHIVLKRNMGRRIMLCMSIGSISLVVFFTFAFYDVTNFITNGPVLSINELPFFSSKSDTVSLRLLEFNSLVIPYNIQLNQWREHTVLTLKHSGKNVSNLRSFPVLSKASLRHHSDFFDRLNGTEFSIIKIAADIHLMRKIIPFSFDTFGNTAAVNYNAPYQHDESTTIFDMSSINEGGGLINPKELPNYAFEDVYQRYKNVATGTKVDLTFILMTTDAYVTSLGAVYKDGMLVESGGCEAHSSPEKNSLIVDEVFTIAQFWGEGYYHATNEELPRIVPWLAFLKNHSNIVIHARPAAFLSRFLERLGLAENRIVTGSVHGRIVYMPAGTACGHIPILGAQIINLEMRTTLPLYSPEERNKIILIKRSAKRWFKNHNAIEAGLRQMASQNRLELVVFDDKHLPSFPDTIALFNKAALVVGPHGAGLSNILFSQPGTFVVEGTCPDKVRMNKCFKTLTHKLGMIHFLFANPENPRDCINTDAAEFLSAVEIAIQLRGNMKAAGMLDVEELEGIHM